MPESSRVRLSTFLGDVCDRERVRRAAQGADIIVHAAALKRVDLAEYDPAECARVNVLGTVSVAQAAIDCGVSRALLISTDKACAPSTLYGATKLCAERIWLASNRYAPTKPPFIACRYGNVTGSAGSVILRWRRDVAAGRRPTLTDERMTRFHLSIDEAVGWVQQALDTLSPGELLVPKLPSYLVRDLAGVISSLPPLIAGRRPAEKLAEALISSEESCYAVDATDRYILRPGVLQQAGGWEYTSSTNPHRLSREALAALVGAVTEEVRA